MSNPPLLSPLMLFGKYMFKSLRFTAAFIYVGLVSFLYLFIAILSPFHPNHVYYIGNIIGFGRFFLGIKLKFLHKERLDSHPSCVFISNHQHNIDVFFGGAAAPKRTVTVGKRAIIWLPFFGMMYYLTGNILINRKNKKSAYGTIEEAADEIKKRKLSVWIMPEGTRSLGRGVLPFKKGAFITAIKAQVPIYPIAISEYHQTLNFNKLNSGTVIISALAPIETLGLTLDDLPHLIKQSEEAIKNEVSRINLLAKNSNYHE